MLFRTFLQRSTSLLPIFPTSYLPYCFSSRSHPDFQHTSSKPTHEIHSIIQDQVTEHPILLYMKGTPSAPMCGFSGKVVEMLKGFDLDFASVNVLQYPSIREGIKEFSDWPTIPQLYVKGEFIGGCDVVREMQESGELKTLLESVKNQENVKKGDAKMQENNN